MAKEMESIFAVAILFLMSVAGAIPFETNTEDREVKNLESFLELQDKTEIRDPSRLDGTDGLAERFDTSYNDEIKDTDFDPGLAERFDGIAYRDDLNDPIHGEEGKEGEAEDEEGDESGSGVNPKPSKPRKKIWLCKKCCSKYRLKRWKFCKFVCQKACPKPRGGRGGRGRPRDVPQSAHFIEDESTRHY